jgi:hypothetical protein
VNISLLFAGTQVHRRFPEINVDLTETAVKIQSDEESA